MIHMKVPLTPRFSLLEGQVPMAVSTPPPVIWQNTVTKECFVTNQCLNFFKSPISPPASLFTYERGRSSDPSNRGHCHGRSIFSTPTCPRSSRLKHHPVPWLVQRRLVSQSGPAYHYSHYHVARYIKMIQDVL